MVSRLALSVIVVSVVAIAATSIVGLGAGERAVERVTERRLGAVRTAEQFELVAFVAGAQATVEGLAASPMTAAAVTAFSDGFRSITVPPPAVQADERSAILAHYRDEVVPALEASTGRPQDPRRLIPETAIGLHLQHRLLVADAATSAGVTRDAVASADDADWFATFAEYDPVYLDVADRLGADELALVDRRGDVVYSARRSTDVATNLLVGPYSGQSFASAVRRALRSTTDEAAFVDLSVYAAAGGRPVWFLVAPVRDPSGEVIGSLALRWTVEPLNAAVAAAAGGPEGLGETAEVLVAGTDRLLRVDPRGFRESPTTYLADAVEAGTLTEADAALARARGTTALLQLADGDVVEAAMTSEGGMLRRTDHLGRPAIMSFGPTVSSLADWVVVSQVPEDEPGALLDDYRRRLLFAAALLIGVITFGAVAWAQRIVRPLRAAGERLTEAAPTADRGTVDVVPGTIDLDGLVDPPTPPIRSGCEEFVRLVDGFERMQATLHRRRDEVARADDRRRSVLRSLLPGPVAARVDSGDRAYVDRVGSASAIVIMIHPRDGAVLDRGRSVDHLLDALVGTIDAKAAMHGVERVKLVGDACFCAVGHQRPYLDHARRAASFARDLLDGAEDWPVRIAIGVASGPVNVGLGGSSHLVFDVWGATVTQAAGLARRAPVATVAVTDATRERLPSSVPTEHDADLDAWRLTVSTVDGDGDGDGGSDVDGDVPTVGGRAWS